MAALVTAFIKTHVRILFNIVKQLYSPLCFVCITLSNNFEIAFEFFDVCDRFKEREKKSTQSINQLFAYLTLSANMQFVIAPFPPARPANDNKEKRRSNSNKAITKKNNTKFSVKLYASFAFN